MEESAKMTLPELIRQQDAAGLTEYMEKREPIDFADEAAALEDESLQVLTSLMTEEQIGTLMEETENKDRIRIARLLDNRRLLGVMGKMAKDEIVDMLGEFPIGRRKEVMKLMKTDERNIITTLLEYPEDSAGGIMTMAYIALQEDLDVSRGLDKIRSIGPKTEVIETLYVINRKRELIGQCDLRDLLTAPRDAKIESIMNTHVISCEPETDQEEVARLVSRYDLHAIPVVSRSMQILGIITVDDVIDVIVEEYDEDMLQMAGVNKEESLDTSLAESVRMRLPWLLINLLTAFLASFTVSLFENTISKVVALSAVMTIVSGMGGNAGTQTMSILVRQLAQGRIEKAKFTRAFFKELLLGVINGAATGLVTAVVINQFYHNFFLGVIVFFAMIGNLLVSGFFGFLVPIILEKLHADPAIASSIFVTTATDVLGFFIFLGLASAFLPLLV
jgi:magnesium transporter